MPKRFIKYFEYGRNISAFVGKPNGRLESSNILIGLDFHFDSIFARFD